MENIDIRLARYFSGESSQEERKEIEAWKEKSVENQEAFDLAKAIWTRSLQAQQTEFNTEEALKKVNEVLDSRTGKTRELFPRYARIAALVAAVVIPVYFLFFPKFTAPGTKELAVITTTSAVKEINLPDGSKVWLNKNSSFSMPKALKGDTYTVTLEGEAYFEITKNPKRVFLIETHESKVQVLGTAFNLKADKNETRTVLTVTEGMVRYSSKKFKQEKVIQKGTEAIIDSKNESLETHTADANSLSWKTGILRFEQVPLKDALRDISAYYQVKIEVADSSLNEVPFSTTLNHTKIEDVMHIIELSMDGTLAEKTEKGYRIRKK